MWLKSLVLNTLIKGTRSMHIIRTFGAFLKYKWILRLSLSLLWTPWQPHDGHNTGEVTLEIMGKGSHESTENWGPFY